MILSVVIRVGAIRVLEWLKDDPKCPTTNSFQSTESGPLYFPRRKRPLYQFKKTLSASDGYQDIHRQLAKFAHSLAQ
jgi:hypothetical protein